jgi:hypothetical protein
MKKLDKIVELIQENYGEVDVLIIDGFDDAVLGFDDRSMRLIYSVTKIIEILVNSGLSCTDAIEHFDYNIKGSYMGDKTPIFCYDNF